MLHCNWPIKKEIPTLANEAVHVWSVALNEMQTKLTFFNGFLSLEEKEQAARFKAAKHRDYFVLARGALRYLLGSYLQVAPNAITFHKNDYGKPEVATSSLEKSKIKFNLSHSDDLALYAFAVDIELGIDVEYKKRELEFLDIAKRFFAPQEWQALINLPTPEQKEAFFRIWSCKEAFIKAVGQGLSYPLHDFVVALEKTSDADRLSLLIPKAAKDNWYLFALNPAPDYAAALVTTIKNPHILTWQLLI